MANGPLVNASSILIGAQPAGTVPNMSDTLNNWLQPMVFGVVVKENVNFDTVETMTEIAFEGVWQPYTFQMLKILAEGQRKWKWFTVHTKVNLELDVDSVITYRGTQYRVMQKGAYNEYGYFEYHLVDDYTGAGPTPEEEEP